MQRTVAVLMTCHNRKDKTIACLKALRQQQLSPTVRLVIFLVDDGSTDGTSQEVQRQFTDIQILQGNGSLYWNGGMRIAFEEARKENIDLYLWVNDDTVLLPTAMASLLQTLSAVDRGGPQQAIIVGSVCDEKARELTYGGLIRCSRWRRLRFEFVQPSSVPQLCDTMNGNCVLVPARVADTLGNLSPAFKHGMGDVDYGLRATKRGFSVWLAPGYVGFCSRNGTLGTWQDRSLGFRDRWKNLMGPKGLPLKTWFTFCRRHAGILWPLYFFSPYLRLLSCLRLTRAHEK